MQKATGWINVVHYDPRPEVGGEGLAHAAVGVAEEFNGGLVGTGSAQFVMVELSDGSAHFAGLELFTGTLDGRAGSFLMRNSGTLRNGTVTSEWVILPGSAGGSLAGLRGTGGTGPSGYWLDYSFS